MASIELMIGHLSEEDNYCDCFARDLNFTRGTIDTYQLDSQINAFGCLLQVASPSGGPRTTR